MARPSDRPPFPLPAHVLTRDNPHLSRPKTPLHVVQTAGRKSLVAFVESSDRHDWTFCANTSRSDVRPRPDEAAALVETSIAESMRRAY